MPLHLGNILKESIVPNFKPKPSFPTTLTTSTEMNQKMIPENLSIKAETH